MKKSIVVALHLLFWLQSLPITLYNLWYAFDHLFTKADTRYFWSFINLANFILGFICFYLFYFYLFPKYLAKKRIVTFVIYGSAVLVTLSILLSIFYFFLQPNTIKGFDYLLKADYLLHIYTAFTGMLYYCITGCLLKVFITWYSEIRVKEQLIQKNLQSELALLKAQINPHFLFNTINNIDILIQKDATAASRYLNQLSDMMRFMLYETSSELIPLAKELEYIKKYIELQKIRTANEKYVNLSITGGEENVMVAPAIFIPFIENAFKHSTNKKIENAINIAIEIEKNEVTFTCLNYFENSASFKQAESGLGLELIKQRLRLLYHENHHLEIVKKESQYEVKLKLETA